ncbi:FapA family protein [Serpentinicella alkaliphila]|uniref:RNA-binding protein KhpB N-terminal domain-containing protein n=1 Tax=Serpentinicella alkaliphila TaxID=1734049 RepID=A0A4R2TSJ5_9FIRM|nr:FapA family protein [Serpentinicella alkaliphila]QUH26306.1 FapA family protein [Serpentinicella alkaliphila]TCQ05886.1 hypothetical protein EDD79_100467 [Serpentinicella alkaliphila]
MSNTNLIFSGDTYEEALKKGLEHLNLTEDKVEVKVLEERKGSFFKKAFIKLEIAPRLTTSNSNVKENDQKKFIVAEDTIIPFKIKYTEEGVFLDVYFFDRPTELQASILEFINIKRVQNVDTNIIKTYINEANPTSILIAPPQQEVLVDEDIEVALSRDKMQCHIVLNKGYGGKSITAEKIISKLNENGINYGISYELIENFLSNKEFNEKVLIAEGKKPINGINAKIIYYFDTHASNSPKMLEDGNVDFKQLNLIKNVKKDELISEITPPTEGVNGYDVTGIELRPLSGKPTNFKKGKNTYESEDGLKLYASRDGQILLKDGVITVSEVLEIAGDIDNSTGNIKFNGKVIVKGNVKSGFSIEADGDIIVYGVVEGARLKSQGDIILNRGVQGNNQAYLECTGNLVAKYIENTKIDVKGSIEADCILHSCAKAKSKVLISGKKGLIAGGEVKAGEEISAITIGSHMGTNTKLEVGIDPDIKKKLNDIKNEITETENKLDGLKKTIELLNKQSKIAKLSQDKQEIFVKSVKAYEVLKERHGSLTLELNIIESKINTMTKGKIHALKTMYPGVKATILNTTRQLYDELANCTLYLKEGEVMIGPYEK